MKAKPKKLYGGRKSELTRLKAQWLRLSSDERAAWQDLFVSGKTQAEIRQAIREKFEINLHSDSQLNCFRDWELDQRERDLEAERQEEDERRFLQEHPEWSLEEARSAVLKKAYLRATAAGDFKLGLDVVKQELSIQSGVLDREKLELLKRKAAQAESTEKVLTERELTPAERERAIKEIYGCA